MAYDSEAAYRKQVASAGDGGSLEGSLEGSPTVTTADQSPVQFQTVARGLSPTTTPSIRRWASISPHSPSPTGMRRGELLGLRWRDVDLNAARLSVKQQYTRQGNGLGFGLPKSKKSTRTIEVDDETIALLREQQERQRFDRRAWELDTEQI